MNSGLKIGIIIGALFLIICCGGGTFFLTQVSEAVGKKADEATKFGDRSVRQILDEYDANVLVSLATPEYAKDFSKDEFQELLSEHKSALGKYVSGKSDSHLVQANVDKENKMLAAKYENKATFEKGQADIVLSLKKVDDKWMISEFKIEPRSE